MKNLFIYFALLISVLSVSCKKETEVKPELCSIINTINIEYRIQNVSGKVNATYIAPNPNTGELQEVQVVIERNEATYSFNYASGNTFSVSASNVNPSHDAVQVQIFVNGVLKVENSTTNPSQNAIAQGNF